MDDDEAHQRDDTFKESIKDVQAFEEEMENLKSRKAQLSPNEEIRLNLLERAKWGQLGILAGVDTKNDVEARVNTVNKLLKDLDRIINYIPSWRDNDDVDRLETIMSILSVKIDPSLIIASETKATPTKSTAQKVKNSRVKKPTAGKGKKKQKQTKGEKKKKTSTKSASHTNTHGVKAEEVWNSEAMDLTRDEAIMAVAEGDEEALEEELAEASRNKDTQLPQHATNGKVDMRSASSSKPIQQQNARHAISEPITPIETRARKKLAGICLAMENIQRNDIGRPLQYSRLGNAPMAAEAKVHLAHVNIAMNELREAIRKADGPLAEFEAYKQKLEGPDDADDDVEGADNDLEEMEDDLNGME